METSKALLLAAVVCLGLFLTIVAVVLSGNSSWELTGVSFGGSKPIASSSGLNSDQPAGGSAVSNSSTDRLIEPKYQSDPFYCRLVFGPQRDFIMMTAADLGARVLYADLNSNGDLTEPGEAFELEEAGQYKQTFYLACVVPELSAGEIAHTNLKIKYGQTGEQVRGVFSVQRWGSSESTTDADLVPLEMTNKSEVIPLLHFDGPLTMGNYRKVVEMPRGQESKFYTLVGTAGESGGTLTAIDNSEIDHDAHPQAEFEFPHQDPSQPPLKVKADLPTRC